MSFIAPAAFALALLLPIIIAMYLLKLRRTEQVVSSVYLWRRMVRDVEANAPWQRLRRNLLLIVQLLFLAFLILALARPFTWTEGIGGRAAILILDISPSMAATDVAPTRLEAAKAQAQRMVDDLPDDVRVTVIAAGEGAQVLAASSLDRRQVRLAIGEIQIGMGGSDLTAALELASALAARQPDVEIVLLTDGRVTLPERLAIKGRVRYVPMGISGDNQAISVLSLQEAPGGGQTACCVTAFAQVVNYGETVARRRLSLYADGQLVNAYDLEIPPGGQRAVVADDLPQAQILQAQLDGADVLPSDDRAWAVHRQADPARVALITEGNLFLETALSLFPNLQVTTVRPEDWEAGRMEEQKDGGELSAGLSTDQPFDLTILDAYIPLTATLPAGNLFFIAPPRSTAYFSVTGQVQQPVPRAVDVAGTDTSGDPLLTHVSLEEVSILEAVRVPLPRWARMVVAGDPADGPYPLLLAGEVAGRRIVVLAWDLHRSDLPLQVAFPLLLANLLNWLAPSGGTDLPAQVAPGVPVGLALPPEVESVRVTRPDGTVARLAVKDGQAVWADTAQLGIYEIEWDGGEAGDRRTNPVAFAVNLFSPSESDVKPADALPLVGIGAEEQGNEATQARREWWRPLAWIALALLILEWLIYQRSVLARIADRVRHVWIRT